MLTDGTALAYDVLLPARKGIPAGEPLPALLMYTTGDLRASHRALSEVPYENLGFPYHRSHEQEVRPIPADEPVELVFDLLPTSRLFRRGNRIRLAIVCADADNFETPALDPAPEVRLLRNATHASFIVLPVIPGRPVSA